MKTRYFIALEAAALLLSGCDDNELRRPAENDGWLKIKIAKLQAVRGTLIDSEDEMLTAGIEQFDVQAWNADSSIFVPKQIASYKEEEWKLATPQLWTGEDVKTFFAYANLPESGMSVVNTFNGKAQKQTLSITQLPLDAREQNDVMMGYYQGTGGDSQTAAITLFHPLTSVVLRQGKMSVDEINKVTLSGIYNEGTVDITYAPADPGPGIVPDPVWGESRKGSVEATMEPASGTAIEVDATSKIIGVPFVVIPQTIAAGDVQITVDVTIEKQSKSFTVDVPAVEWMAGYTKSYLLNCNVSTNFELTVTPWDADSASLEMEDVNDVVLLPGKFSVSADEYVQFSRGNLQFKAGDGSVASPEWRFAEHQYDYIGNASGNTTAEASRATQSEWIDLFGWGATGRTDLNANLVQPYEIKKDNAIYKTGASAATNETLTRENGGDWGVCMGDGWFTLTAAQWQYLLGSSTERNGKYKYNVTVCGIGKCLIIVPDVLKGYTFDSNKTSYNAEEWETAEAAGLVCLPPAGRRANGSVGYVGVHGQYWSSSADSKDAKYAQYLYIDSESIGLPGNPGYYDNRYESRSVRLVKKFSSIQSLPGWKNLGILSDNGKTLLWSEYDVVGIDKGVATLASDNESYHSVVDAGLFTWEQASSITSLASFPEGVTGTVRLPSYNEVGRLKKASNKSTFKWINTDIKGGQITLNNQTVFFLANGYYSGSSMINNTKAAQYWCGTDVDHNGQLIINFTSVGHNDDRADTDALSVRLVIEVSAE